MTQDFNDTYNQLTDTLRQLEEKRTALKAQGTKNGTIAAGIIVVVGAAISLYIGAGWTGIIVAAVLAAIVYFSVINAQSAPLTTHYKEKVITQIVDVICKGAQFQPGSGISEQVFINSGLFSQEPDRYHCEDLITGQVDKTTFSCSEVHAEERQVSSNGKQTQVRWVDIFQGFLFIADFQKDFRGQTTIYRNSWIKLRLGEQRVKLEDPIFEETFDVYSNNQVEARYILTPSTMERFLALDRKFPGKITISFRNSNVIIAIPDTTNHFEASIWSSVTDRQKLEQEFSTIHALVEIVNDLNLNTRIWTKE